MNRKEAARFLGVSTRAVDALTAEGRLRPRYERRPRGVIAPVFDETDLLRFQEEAHPGSGSSDPGPIRPALSPRVWSLLACPVCTAPLEQVRRGATCNGCEEVYGYTITGALDLRPRRPKAYLMEIEIPPAAPERGGFGALGSDLRVETSVIMPSGEEASDRGRSWWASRFPVAKADRNMMLDLGCGSAPEQGLAESSGYEYVGLDYDSPHAPLLGDVHALPFLDNSFDLILATALLEHVRYPFVMARETYRVLKPRGTFLGTVAFLEPFHQNSFYHHTHLGTLNTLRCGGFTGVEVVPSHDWSVLQAQATMGLFPDMPVRLARALVWPLETLHRLWWRRLALRRGKPLEAIRICHTTGAFSFAATKVSPPDS